MEVRILGPLEVWEDGRQVELGGGRQRALLAILALRANEVVSSDRLIDELWGGQPPPTAHKALQNLVSHLRSTIDPERKGVLVTKSPGYVLELEDAELDAVRFERLVAEGRQALEEDPARAADRLREALALWRGEPLADFAYERFAQGEIARLEELKLGALEDRIDADLSQGRHTELVSELERLVATNALREPLRGQLMLALYRSGRQAEALDAYKDGRRELQGELGLEPGPALRDLQQAILNQDPKLGQPSRPPRPPRPARGVPRRRIGAMLSAVLVVAAVALVALIASRGDAALVVVPDSLVKIDPATNEIVDVVAVGRDPGQVRVVGEYVFAASVADKTLTRLHIGSGDVVTSGEHGADGGLADAGNRFVWASSVSRAEVVWIDAESLLPIDGVPLPRDLVHAFVAVGGGSLWVSQYAPPMVSRYRLRTLQLERRYPFQFVELPVEVTFGEGAAWVGLGGSSALLRIDARDGRTSQIPVGRKPSDPAVGFGSVWTAMADDGTVWRVDALAEKTNAIVKVGTAPFGVTIGGDSVWVTNHCDGTVVRIDPRTDEVVATIETGHFPKWLAVGAGYVWVGIAGEKALDFEGCD